MRNETGKQRKSLIDLGYLAKPDKAVGARIRLTLGTLLISTLWLVLSPTCDKNSARGPRLFEWNRLASPGALTASHALWESQCGACHLEFKSINGSQWTPSSGNGSRSSDQQCQACHRAYSHSPFEIESETPACAECHRDHQGGDRSLISRDDGQCVGCHANIREHSKRPAGEGSHLQVMNTTRFDGDPDHHPAFFKGRKGGAADPGTMKFNHSLHLARGLASHPDEKPFRFSALDRQDWQKYGWVEGDSLESAVQLDCASCHQSEENAKRSMRPVTYERDCRACHPLTFDRLDESLRMRHGLSPREVVAELRRVYRDAAFDMNPELLLRPLAPNLRPRPGDATRDDTEPSDQAIERSVLAALRMLFSGKATDMGTAEPGDKRRCAECHVIRSNRNERFGIESVEKMTIVWEPPPYNWFSSARFDHHTHQALTCASCHPGAANSTTQQEVLIPKIETCIRCHGAATTSTSGDAGNACTLCHGYHDSHQSGRGSADSRWTVAEFLNGRLPLTRESK
jgi:predicted CXXCH cytochrome family protein